MRLVTKIRCLPVLVSPYVEIPPEHSLAWINIKDRDNIRSEDVGLEALCKKDASIDEVALSVGWMLKQVKDVLARHC